MVGKTTEQTTKKEKNKEKPREKILLYPSFHIKYIFFFLGAGEKGKYHDEPKKKKITERLWLFVKRVKKITQTLGKAAQFMKTTHSST